MTPTELAPGLFAALEEVRRIKGVARNGQYNAAYQQALVDLEICLASMHLRAEQGEYIHPVSPV
jgi:hypothetical protein